MASEQTASTTAAQAACLARLHHLGEQLDELRSEGVTWEAADDGRHVQLTHGKTGHRWVIDLLDDVRVTPAGEAPTDEEHAAAAAAHGKKVAHAIRLYINPPPMPTAETGPAPEKWAEAPGASEREPFAGVGIGSSASSPTGMVAPPTE